MFCRYCGQEILDEAVLCPHCGVMVKKLDCSALQGQAQTPQSMQQSVDNSMDLKKTKAVRIFAVITAVLVAVSLMLLLSGIVEEIYFRVNMQVLMQSVQTDYCD